jgi:hypothetical protein
MNDDHPVIVPRIADFDLTVFYNIQIDIRLTGPEDCLTIGVVTGDTQGLNHRDFCVGKSGKRDVFYLNHSSSPML